MSVPTVRCPISILVKIAAIINSFPWWQKLTTEVCLSFSNYMIENFDILKVQVNGPLPERWGEQTNNNQSKNWYIKKLEVKIHRSQLESNSQSHPLKQHWWQVYLIWVRLLWPTEPWIWTLKLPPPPTHSIKITRTANAQSTNIQTRKIQLPLVTAELDSPRTLKWAKVIKLGMKR